MKKAHFMSNLPHLLNPQQPSELRPSLRSNDNEQNGQLVTFYKTKLITKDIQPALQPVSLLKMLPCAVTLKLALKISINYHYESSINDEQWIIIITIISLLICSLSGFSKWCVSQYTRNKILVHSRGGIEDICGFILMKRWWKLLTIVNKKNGNEQESLWHWNFLWESIFIFA